MSFFIFYFLFFVASEETEKTKQKTRLISSSSVPLSLFPNLQPPQITKKNETGGCYAKCIGLKAAQEPEIWKAIRFGAVLENVVFDENSRHVDFDSNAVTENTRASYPIDHIDNARIPCVGPHPRNLVLLCCDAFGVLPPVRSSLMFLT